MSLNPSTAICSTLVRILLIVTGLGAIGIASAQGVPRSFVASPDIYKVVAQADESKYLVILATWKPGERDKFHSEPARGAYFLTDCQLRSYFPGEELHPRWIHDPAGAAFVRGAVPSVSLENVGGSECKLLLFERK